MTITCKDVMVADQPTLAPEDTVIKAFRLMRKKGVRFLPVVKPDGVYVGVFTSPTLIKLLLPRAITLQSGSSKDTNMSLNNLSFYKIDDETFHDSLVEIKDKPVVDYLSQPENIPLLAPDISVMEGVLMLHKCKRHVILVEPESEVFVGVVTINSVLEEMFDEDHDA